MVAGFALSLEFLENSWESQIFFFRALENVMKLLFLFPCDTLTSKLLLLIKVAVDQIQDFYFYLNFPLKKYFKNLKCERVVYKKHKFLK